MATFTEAIHTIGGERQIGDAEDYLVELAQHQHEPVLLIQQHPLAEALETVGGAKGFSVPDVLEPYQISLPLYIGATTPQATSEVPHWHPEQAEAYVVLSGEAEILAKYRWEDGWITRVAEPGDVLVVQPEVCHWFRWRTEHGLALVFKAPQRAGVGRFPNGKVVCRYCPHFNRGCTPPDQFLKTSEQDRPNPSSVDRDDHAPSGGPRNQRDEDKNEVDLRIRW